MKSKKLEICLLLYRLYKDSIKYPAMAYNLYTYNTIFSFTNSKEILDKYKKVLRS